MMAYHLLSGRFPFWCAFCGGKTLTCSTVPVRLSIVPQHGVEAGCVRLDTQHHA